jgi:hypothetical protein
MYTLQWKPDQHAKRIPRSVYVWSQTIRISRGQRIATFRESSTDLDGSHNSREKGIPDYTLRTSADRSVGPNPVSLPLSTKEVVGLSQCSINSMQLGLLGPYLRHVASTFNTCSWVPTSWSLTNIGRGYNLGRVSYPHHTPQPSQPMVLHFPPKGPAWSPVIQSQHKPLVR